MKIYQKTGFNRLAKLIAILGFITTYITLLINERSVREVEAFIESPIVSVIVALGVFVITRLVYWVIDGFSEANEESV